MLENAMKDLNIKQPKVKNKFMKVINVVTKWKN